MSNRKIHWKTFNKLRINDALLKKESKHLLAWISSCYMKNLCCKHSFCIFWRELCPHFSNKRSITWIIMLSWCWHFTQFIGLLLSSQMSNRKIHWKTFNKLRINDALLKKESKQLLLQYKERNDKENHIDCILSLRLKQLTNQPYKIGYNSICWNIDNSIHSKKDHRVFDSFQ